MACDAASTEDCLTDNNAADVVDTGVDIGVDAGAEVAGAFLLVLVLVDDAWVDSCRADPALSAAPERGAAPEAETWGGGGGGNISRGLLSNWT